MRLRVLLILIVSNVLALSASRAKADAEDVFTYTSYVGNVFIWDLPSSPIPSSYVLLDAFTIDDVPFSENGVPQTSGSFVFFSYPAYDGGFTAPDMSPSGIQLYSGSEEAPTFLPGTYMFPLDEGTLVIAATPEPSSLLLFGTGLLALLGLSLCLCRKSLKEMVCDLLPYVSG